MVVVTDWHPQRDREFSDRGKKGMRNYFRDKTVLQVKTYSMYFQCKSVKKGYVKVNSNSLIPLKVVHVLVTDFWLGTLMKMSFYLFQPCFS